jgi:hypothetical protein
MKFDFNLLLNPIIAMTIICFGLVIYIVALDEEGMFSKKFLHFGPGTDASNTATFMGITIDNWKKNNICISYFVYCDNTISILQ